jgi:predicted ester cyclase
MATNEQIYRRLIEEVFNQGNLEVADELVAPEAVEHQASGMGDGPEGLKRTASSLRKAFPDFTLTIEELVSAGDKVWARQRGGGTNDGSFMGRPPTGRAAFIEVFDVTRFENGRVVEHWGVPDRLQMAIELGILPAPPVRVAAGS